METTSDIRTLDTSQLSVRSLDDGTKQISGYALTFNEPSQPMPFIEYIKPGALDGVNLSQVLLLYGHEYNDILARADSNTLTTKVDDKGLYFEATLADTQLANDVYNDIEAGNIKGCSFGFRLPQSGGDTWSTDNQGNTIHTITQIASVSEISLTPIPAYTQTSVRIERDYKEFLSGGKREKMDNNKSEAPTSSATPATSASTAPADSAGKGLDNLTSIVQALAAKVDDCMNQMSAAAEPDTRDDDEIQDDATDKTDEEPTGSAAPAGDQPAEPDNKKKVDGKMAKDITPGNQEKEEVRDFKAFLRGEKRDANTVGGFSEGTDGGAVIPVDVLDVLAQPNDPSLLSGYVNKVSVASPTGKLPVLARATAQMATATELAENPAIANATITPVNYDVATLRGALPVSMEMVQDYPNITGILSQYVSTIKDRTEQRKIGAVLAQATAVSATSIDDIKNAYNSNDLVWYTNKVFVVSASAYAWLDTQKDTQGRYLLQDSIASATGKQLLGASVITVADDVLGKAGELHIFIGDVKSFVLEAIKSNISVAWTRNEQFEQILGVVLRADFKVADAGAGQFLTITPATSGGSGK